MANLKTKNSIRRQLRWLRNLRDYYLDDREFVRILGNDSNLLIVFYVQIMPDDFVMQLHRF